MQCHMIHPVANAFRAYRVKPVAAGCHTPHDADRPVVGEVLEMDNGEVWFHPYSGAAPWRTELQTRAA